MRVDVDAQRDPAQLPAGRQLVDGAPDGGHGPVPLGGLEEELAAVLAAEPEPRRGPEHLDVGREGLRKPPAGQLRDLLGPLGLGRTELEPDEVGVGRIPQSPAALELGCEEARGVMYGRMADRGRVGSQRLDEDSPALGPASASPGQLGNQRKGPLLRPEVGESQRGVGVEDDAQQDVREVVPLAHHLRTHQHARVRGFEPPQDVEMGAGGSGAVGVEAKHGLRRHRFADQLSDTLGPGAMAGQGDGAAVRAALRQRFGMAAVVAAKPARALVDDERDVALGAPPPSAAGSTAHERRPATAVQHHDRLPADIADLAECLDGPRVEGTAIPRGRPHVEHVHRGQRDAVGALRQLEPGQAVPALRTRRRAAADEDGPGRLRATGRHLPRVVARIPLLLVGGVVLLVHHDQPGIANRREHGRPGADAHPRLARVQAMPLVAALAGREPGVKQGHVVAEPRREPGDGLRREGDLGNQHDGAAAAGQHGLGGRQVHLRLAGSGHAVEQELGVLGSVDGVGDRAERRRLSRVERRPARPGSHVDDRRTPRALRRPQLHQPARPHPPKRRGVGAGRLKLARRELASAIGTGIRERADRGALDRAQPRAVLERRAAGRSQLRPELGAGPRSTAGAPDARGEHQLEPAGGGGAVLTSHPEPEPHELGRCPGLERLERLGEALGRQIARLGHLHDDSDDALPSERHDEHRPHSHAGQPLGERVVERAAKRAGGQEGLDPGDRHMC